MTFLVIFSQKWSTLHQNKLSSTLKWMKFEVTLQYQDFKYQKVTEVSPIRSFIFF